MPTLKRFAPPRARSQGRTSEESSPSDPPASESPALMSPESKGTKGRIAPSPDRRATKTAPPRSNPATPSVLATLSPSPHQVVSDLIDATCHEILLVMGKDPESIAPFGAYAPLLQRLDYYMAQLDRDQNEEETDCVDNREGPIEDSGTRCRLFMAKLAIQVCSRSAYPEEFVDTAESQQLEPLIDMTASQWEELHDNMEKLLAGLQDGKKMSPAFESLNCQMEAMGALHKLRGQLLAVLQEINNEKDGKRPASHFVYLRNHIEEYEKTVGVIDGKLRNIHQTSHGDLFVPNQMLSIKLDVMEECVTSIVDGILDMIDKKVFPLKNFQVRFLGLLKDWERQYLSQPALFKVGYFGKSPSSSCPRATAAAGTPVSPTISVASSCRHRNPHCEDHSGSDDESEGEYIIQNKAKGGSSLRQRRGRKRIESDSDDGSDSKDYKLLSRLAKSCNANAPSVPGDGRKEISASAPTSSPRQRKGARSTRPKLCHGSNLDVSAPEARTTKQPPPTKKGKRIRFTEEEKDALQKGLKRFGLGKWREILDCYWYVFEKNERDNVSLKDLYRTMLKKGEI